MPALLHFLLLALMYNPFGTSGGNIKVTVTDVNNKAGDVMVALFSSPKGFPYETIAVQKQKGKL